jgi:hypothetical protein
MSTTEAALAKLLDAVCPNNTLPTPPQTLPAPPTLQKDSWKEARNAQFGALDDLQAAFAGHRDTHVKFMGGAARRALKKDCVRNEPRQKPLPVPVCPDRSQPMGGPWSLMYSLLCVVDPSVGLLTTEEQLCCTATFVERTARSIGCDVRGIAAAYRIAAKPQATLQLVVESLRDPTAALADETANDAALLHVSALLGAALVLRRSNGGGCMVLPPDAAGSDPAILIAWSHVSGGYELITPRREPISSIRRRLCHEAGITGPPPCASTTLTELLHLAERVAVQHLPGGGRVTKERVARAIADAASS